MGAYKQICPLFLYNTMKFLLHAGAGLQSASRVCNGLISNSLLVSQSYLTKMVLGAKWYLNGTWGHILICGVPSAG